MVYIPRDYDKDFRDKVAVVTGGDSGIGRSIAEGLAYHGARVCILDINKERTQESEHTSFYETDVSNRKSIKKSIERVVSEHGAPWILVNNAGIEINERGNLITMPYEDMMKITNTNLFGYINMLREVIPHMEENGGGRIVNISSVQAIQSCLPGTIYQVTKQGILGLSRVMSVEYAKRNIRVNTVIPGKIRTEGMGNARLDTNPHALDKLLESTPMGRGGHVEEITHPVLFLLSEGASFITGTELVVDGGLLNTLIGDQGVPNPPVPNDPDRV